MMSCDRRIPIGICLGQSVNSMNLEHLLEKLQGRINVEFLSILQPTFLTPVCIRHIKIDTEGQFLCYRR